MTDKRQEELKKLLVAADFKQDSYKELSMQELIILKNSAMASKEKNLGTQKNAMFFTRREEFFKQLVLLRLQKMETMYAVFAPMTSLPFVTCDPDSCNDQIWLFSEENLAKNAAAAEQKNKRQLVVVKLENKQFLPFYLSLFNLGVNELLLDRGANAMAVPLTSLVKSPDFSKLPPEKRPVMNPELLLTAIYFAQDRVLPEEERDDENLHDLEEEMMVNLQRGKLLMPVQVPEGSTGQIQTKDMRFPLLKLQNGDSFQPVCTDPNEFQKFAKGQNFRAITVDCQQLKALLNKESKGILLNPASVRLIIPKEKI